MEYFGEGDRIPHHRYGIYSNKWGEHRNAVKHGEEEQSKFVKVKKIGSTKIKTSWPNAIPSLARTFHLRHNPRISTGCGPTLPGTSTKTGTSSPIESSVASKGAGFVDFLNDDTKESRMMSTQTSKYRENIGEVDIAVLYDRAKLKESKLIPPKGNYCTILCILQEFF